MAKYIVLFDQSPLASSDAAVGQEHVENTNIYAEVKTAKVAFVEADSPLDAEKVVYVAYNGSSDVPVVLTADAVVEVERETVPVDEPESSAEPNAAPVGEPVGVAGYEERTTDEPQVDTDVDTADAEATVEPEATASDTDTAADTQADTAGSVQADAEPVVAGEPVTVEPVEDESAQE